MNITRILSFGLCLVGVSAFAGAKSFVGGSAAGVKDWSLAANWSDGKVPSEKDDVTIVGKAVVATNALAVRSLKLSENASLTVGDGKSARATGLRVAGDLVLKDTAVLHVRAGEAEPQPFDKEGETAAALWKAACVVSVGEHFAVLDKATVRPEAAVLSGAPVVFRAKDFVLAEGASFDAVKLGWGWSSGLFSDAPKGATQRVIEGKKTADFWTVAPGAGVSYSRGGVYDYGSAFAPFLPGSPSGNYYARTENPELGRGPGSIVIFASNRARIDGALVADADLAAKPTEGDGGRPSGGAIWLGLNHFTFGPRARLSVRGGCPTSGNQFGPGAGGRIALAVGLSGAELDALALGGKTDAFEVSETVPFVACDVRGGHRPKDPNDPGVLGSQRVVRARSSEIPVTVRGTPVAVDGVKPANGTVSYARGKSVAFTAPSRGTDVKDEGVRYACAGYVVSNATGVVASGKDASVDVRVGADPIVVTWRWKAPEYRVCVRKPAHGAVVADGKRLGGDFVRWVKDGKMPKVTIEPDAHYVFLGWKTALPSRVEAPFETEPLLVYGAAAADATLVAVTTNNASVYEKPLAIVGKPQSLGVEIEGEAAGVKIALVVTDKRNRTFKRAVDATGAFTLCALDPAEWRSSDPKAKTMEYPIALSTVAVRGGAAKLKGVRAVYERPLGRAGRHFASNESRGQKLGGTVVAAEKGETVTLGLPERAGVRFVLHGAKGCRLETVWDSGFTDKRMITVRDQTENLLADFAGMKKGTPFTVRDSIIDIGSQVRQFVRPYFRPYRSNSEMVPMGFDYLADAEQLPGASEHVNDWTFVHRPDGRYDLVWDGSLATTLTPPRSQPKARVKELRLVFAKDSEYALKKPAASAVDTDRYEMLDFAANPRAKAFSRATLQGLKAGETVTVGGAPVRVAAPLDSADVAICHQGKGGWALEVDEYTGRKPLDGFGAAVHYRVPARDYVRAHVLFALDDDEKKDRVMNLRLAHYFLNGAGSNMTGDALVDFTKGIPDGVKKVGAVTREGKSYGVYAVTVALNGKPCVAEAARGGYIDFEFMGKKDGNKPDAKRESAFNIFGATLEASPLTLDVIAAPGAPCNVFTEDEAEKYLTLRLRSERPDAKGRVSWKVTDWNGKALFDGAEVVGPLAKREKKDIRVAFDAKTGPGLYLVNVKVEGDGGATTYEHQARLAVLPPSGRLVGTEESPYATWWFFGSHGSPNDWDVGGPVLKKAGIRKSCHANWPTNEMKKYSVTFTGNCKAPSQRMFFDPKTGHFKPQKGLSGEQWFVEQIREQIRSKPFVDHILIWHESCPRGVIPEEILDLPVPPADDEDRAAGAYVNECGRLVRKYFPNLKIQIGNSSASLGASYRPFRGGADPQYYDAVGIETPSQAMMPERLLVWGLQGMMMTKEAASYYAKRPVPAAACYEYVYRTERAVGEELQAAWYMRDVLISLANRMPMISPAVTFDVKNAYYDTLWGRAGMLYRAPFCEPKLSYVAYAALTKALDGVTYVKELDTGSTTVYALLFRRCDGKYATAVWTARGEAELKLEGGGDGTVMDMCGKVSKLGGLFSGRTVEASELPAYVLTEQPVEGVAIKARRFRQAETAAKRAKPVVRLADAAAVTVEPDARLKSRGHGCLPMMRPSDHFSVKAVKDDEKGACLEVTLDTKAEKVNRYFTEYSTLRLKEPVAIPAGSGAIGVWVKGNSSWGQVRFELEDADGDVYVNYTHPTLWDTLDWQGLLCVNFDGWAYVSCWLPGAGGLAYDRETGLRNGPWARETGARGSNGRFDLPAKLKAITVGINREKLDILDFKKSVPTVRLGEVAVEPASKKRGASAGVRIVIDGAEAD